MVDKVDKLIRRLMSLEPDAILPIKFRRQSAETVTPMDDNDADVENEHRICLRSILEDDEENVRLSTETYLRLRILVADDSEVNDDALFMPVWESIPPVPDVYEDDDESVEEAIRHFKHRIPNIASVTTVEEREDVIRHVFEAFVIDVTHRYQSMPPTRNLFRCGDSVIVVEKRLGAPATLATIVSKAAKGRAVLRRHKSAIARMMSKSDLLQTKPALYVAFLFCVMVRRLATMFHGSRVRFIHATLKDIGVDMKKGGRFRVFLIAPEKSVMVCSRYNFFFFSPEQFASVLEPGTMFTDGTDTGYVQTIRSYLHAVGCSNHGVPCVSSMLQPDVLRDFYPSLTQDGHVHVNDAVRMSRTFSLSHAEASRLFRKKCNQYKKYAMGSESIPGAVSPEEGSGEFDVYRIKEIHRATRDIGELGKELFPAIAPEAATRFHKTEKLYSKVLGTIRSPGKEMVRPQVEMFYRTYEAAYHLKYIYQCVNSVLKTAFYGGGVNVKCHPWVIGSFDQILEISNLEHDSPFIVHFDGGLLTYAEYITSLLLEASTMKSGLERMRTESIRCIRKLQLQLNCDEQYVQAFMESIVTPHSPLFFLFWAHSVLFNMEGLYKFASAYNLLTAEYSRIAHVRIKSAGENDDVLWKMFEPKCDPVKYWNLEIAQWFFRQHRKIQASLREDAKPPAGVGGAKAAKPDDADVGRRVPMVEQLKKALKLIPDNVRPMKDENINKAIQMIQKAKATVDTIAFLAYFPSGLGTSAHNTKQNPAIQAARAEIDVEAIIDLITAIRAQCQSAWGRGGRYGWGRGRNPDHFAERKAMLPAFIKESRVEGPIEIKQGKTGATLADCLYDSHTFDIVGMRPNLRILLLISFVDFAIRKGEDHVYIASNPPRQK